MGALSHYIEEAGVPTAGISLVREHTERIQPPRALWVPFELGRPLGAPNEPEFQLDVLRTLLGLLDRSGGPVLEDYPREAPAGADGGEPWSCPVAFPPPKPAETEMDALRERLLGEISLLQPWYREAVRSRGRTSVGPSGLSGERANEMATFLATIASGDSPAPPEGAREEMPLLVRFLADDLKAYYFEATTAQPGRSKPGSKELNDWLFGETALGDVLYSIRDLAAASEDQGQKVLAYYLIPQTHAQRPEIKRN